MRRADPGHTSKARRAGHVERPRRPLAAPSDCQRPVCVHETCSLHASPVLVMFFRCFCKRLFSPECNLLGFCMLPLTIMNELG